MGRGLSSSLLRLSFLLCLSLPLGNAGFSPLLVCAVSAGSSGLGGRVREVRPSLWEAGWG